MVTETIICDWFYPYEDNTPVGFIVERPEGMVLFLNHPAIWEAFCATFAECLAFDPEEEGTSTYVYRVFDAETDLSKYETSPITWVRVKIEA